ncbi:MAG: outer membrane beta-barrel protein [Deltaproteobacteria bacterium]|nr:outer membrane beta-barrel protein [Deltaproteobacteria bacterium]
MHGWYKLWAGAIVLATALLCGPSAASAQTLVKYNEGPGLKLSNSVVLPGGGAVMTSYDTNVFYTKQGAIGSFFLTPIAHVDLATLPPQRLEGQPEGTQAVDFRLRFAAGYRAYISDNQSVKDQSNVDLDAGLSLVINPKGRYKGTISDEYVRTVTPQNLEGPGSYIRDYNVASARLDIAPGGGMLGFALGYSFTMDWWENSFTNLAAGSKPNMFAHLITLDGKWKFLPKTAVVLNVSQGIVSRPDLVIGAVEHPDSDPFRVEAGLIGQLTYRLSATVKAGYGNGFYQAALGRPSPASFNNALVTAQLRWQIATTGSLTLGFTRNFFDSLFSDYYTDNRATLRYDHMLFSRLVLHLDGGYTYREYDGLDQAVWGITSRNDNVIEGHAGVDWRIKEWLFVGAGYDLMYVNAGRDVVFAGQPYNPSYVKHVVFFRAEVSY